jgi:hypothetical protein
MSSNFIVSSLPPLPALFFSSLERSGKNKAEMVKGTEQSRGRVAGRVAARCVTNGVAFCLARHRRISPKRPSEPRLSGVHPEEAEWDDRTEAPIRGLRTRCRRRNGFSRCNYRAQPPTATLQIIRTCSTTYKTHRLPRRAASFKSLYLKRPSRAPRFDYVS